MAKRTNQSAHRGRVGARKEILHSAGGAGIDFYPQYTPTRPRLQAIPPGDLT